MVLVLGGGFEFEMLTEGEDGDVDLVLERFRFLLRFEDDARGVLEMLVEVDGVDIE